LAQNRPAVRAACAEIATAKFADSGGKEGLIKVFMEGQARREIGIGLVEDTYV